MNYGWIITDDWFGSSLAPERTVANARGITGPKNITETILQLLHDGAGQRFRMLTEDGTVLYLGRMIDLTLDRNHDIAPLDDLGVSRGGCTRIQYQTTRGWEEGR